jgi:hypothetical protein
MPLLVKSRVQYASILGRDFVGGPPKGSTKGGPPKGSSKGVLQRGHPKVSSKGVLQRGHPKVSSKGVLQRGPPKGSSKGVLQMGVIKDYCASRLRWRAGASGHHREGPWGSPWPEAPWPEAPARQRKREAQ